MNLKESNAMPADPTSDLDRRLDAIAARHGFGIDAARAALDALVRGGGAMAQFSHPELGGRGQWMRGGMTMIGRMGDDALRARVAALCADLVEMAAFAARERVPFASSERVPFASSERVPFTSSEPAPFASSGHAAGRSTRAGEWWPAGLGAPTISGAQNDRRYAYFDAARRLAIEEGGRVTVYDTGEHRIGGFSQQQPGGAALAMSSQRGPVELASLSKPCPLRIVARRPQGGFAHPL